MTDALAFDADARAPVSPAEAVSRLQIGIVLVGISITLPLMHSAGELARAMGWLQLARQRCWAL